MKTFVIGDIHGAHKALVQCFERSGFDGENHRLIALGDVCDGYPDVKECIDELLKIKHCEFIIGNHDLWTLDWALRGIKEDLWLSQGGLNTITSYDGDMPAAHIDFLKKAHLWFEFENQLFVHGGFDPDKPLTKQDLQTLVWDRELIEDARRREMRGEQHRYTKFEEIFLGHTTTEMFGSDRPLKFCNIWALDTGAGWSGQLTIMDVHTKHYWQSDSVKALYPGMKVR